MKDFLHPSQTIFDPNCLCEHDHRDCFDLGTIDSEDAFITQSKIVHWEYSDSLNRQVINEQSNIYENEYSI